MIEFKAECGHTVRAKDEDAGGVVRCSYCGRTAAVPENERADLSFLFDEVAPSTDEGRWPGLRRRRRGTPKARRGPREFNPFSVIFRLCYVALLIVVVVIISRKFVAPLFDPEARSRHFAGVPSAATPPKSDTSEAVRPVGRYGLLGTRALNGLYVSSTPPGAAVFCIEESQAPSKGRIGRLPTVTQFRADGDATRVADGTYVVEVVFAWNDPHLSDPNLSNYRKYVAFRRAIESGSDSQRKQLVEAFFLPDEASDVFIDETVDQIYIVRQYRSVAVRQGKSPGVRALFLPRITAGDGGFFLIEPLVTGYLPAGKAYEYDEAHVRGELAYYGVPDADQPFVLQALSRIGVIPYMVPDGRVRLFKIDLHDGAFATRVIREPER